MGMNSYSDWVSAERGILAGHSFEDVSRKVVHAGAFQHMQKFSSEVFCGARPCHGCIASPAPRGKCRSWMHRIVFVLLVEAGLIVAGLLSW